MMAVDTFFKRNGNQFFSDTAGNQSDYDGLTVGDQVIDPNPLPDEEAHWNTIKGE